MDQSEMRGALLADDPIETVTVEHRGVTVEVRPPSLAQQKYFRRQAMDPKTKEIDDTKLVVHSIIGCTYKPGTDERVFELADVEALLNKSTDPRTIVGKLSRAITKIMSVTQEDVEGNFGEGPSAT